MSLDGKIVNGNMPAASRVLTQRVLKCSNEDCEFHLKEAIFEQKTLVHIAYDVLRPGEFAPMMCGLRAICTGCGWVMAIKEGDAKPSTVPPDEK